MAINDKIMELMKEEISKDPEKRGYAGKTDEEVQALLNEAYVKQIVTEVIQTPRISAILAGIPNTENVIDTKDVTDSKVFTKEII